MSMIVLLLIVKKFTDTHEANDIIRSDSGGIFCPDPKVSELASSCFKVAIFSQKVL